MNPKNCSPKIYASIGLCCAVLLAGCTASGQKNSAAPGAPVPVVVVTVQPSDVAIFGEFAAQTYARDMVEVRGRVEGYIEKWLFTPGSDVRAGQELYLLDLRPYEAAVQQARGNLHQGEADLEFAQKQVALLQVQANLASAEAAQMKARQDVDRITPLVKADAASRQDLDAAAASLKAADANVAALRANIEQTTLSTRTQINSMRAKVEALEAAVRTAELNRDYATIRAPIAGRIGDSQIPVGGLVNPNAAQPLTTIVPVDPIWVRFKVSESDYLAWKRQGARLPGGSLPLTLILADKSEFQFPGHVENSLNQIDPKTGTLELQARFPNPKGGLLSGQFGRVRMQTAIRKNVILVPQRAVQQLQSMETVYTVSPDNKVEVRPITGGDRTGAFWVIEQGLQPGDQVIVEGQLKVRPGVLVKPQPYRPSETPTAPRKAGN